MSYIRPLRFNRIQRLFRKKPEVEFEAFKEGKELKDPLVKAWSNAIRVEKVGPTSRTSDDSDWSDLWLHGSEIMSGLFPETSHLIQSQINSRQNISVESIILEEDTDTINACASPKRCDLREFNGADCNVEKSDVPNKQSQNVNFRMLNGQKRRHSQTVQDYRYDDLPTANAETSHAMAYLYPDNKHKNQLCLPFPSLWKSPSNYSLASCSSQSSAYDTDEMRPNRDQTQLQQTFHPKCSQTFPEYLMHVYATNNHTRAINRLYVS